MPVPLAPSSRPTRRRAPSRSLRRRRGLVAAAAAAALTAAGCTASTPEQAAEQAPGLPQTWDTSLHVHGLGVNPAEPDAVYAATHTGVWRIPLDPARGIPAGTPTRIADRWQDTMGFTVTGPDVFLASGHPDPREDAPPHLGLLRSTDRARTWDRVSLTGQADFHDLEPGPGGRLYGYDATSEQIRVSTDSGATWASAAAGRFGDLAADPVDPDVVLAISDTGLLRSSDAARTFTPVPGAPPLALLDWAPADTSSAQVADRALVGIAADGSVWRADPAAAGARLTWSEQGRLPSPPQALTAVTSSRLLAADAIGVLHSTDGGRSWTRLTPTTGGTAPTEEGHSH